MSGKINKSALYKLHKGEVVVPAYKVKVVNKVLKKSKIKKTMLSSTELSKRKVKPIRKLKKKRNQTTKRKKEPSSLFNFFR